jgi:DNA-binding NtrC family response regulator
MLAKVGSAMLAHHGFEVTTMTSSTAALKRFREDPDRFNLVFTDQTMPELSGTELAAELLKIRPDLPIVLCTGYSRKVSEEEALAVGIKAFCMKPLDLQATVGTVRRVLDRRGKA